MMERAHQSVWWPKIGEEIVQIVQQCAHCQKYKPTTAKEPMVPTVLPDRPWQMLGVDLLDFNGQQYMVVVDYYSRYIELVYLADTIMHTVTAKLKCMFARFGIPDLLVSDNGPQFSSKEFSTICGFVRFHTSDLKSILSAGERSVRASRSGCQNKFGPVRSYVSTASISLNATCVDWV